MLVFAYCPQTKIDQNSSWIQVVADGGASFVLGVNGGTFGVLPLVDVNRWCNIDGCACT
jgi:hypothetical protein